MLLVPLYTNNLLSDFAIILLWQSYVPSMVNVMQYIFFFFLHGRKSWSGSIRALIDAMAFSAGSVKKLGHKSFLQHTYPIYIKRMPVYF